MVVILVVVLIGAGRVNVGLVYLACSSALAAPVDDNKLKGVGIVDWLCEMSGDSFERIDGFDPSEFCRLSACPLMVWCRRMPVAACFPWKWMAETGLLTFVSTIVMGLLADLRS